MTHAARARAEEPRQPHDQDEIVAAAPLRHARRPSRRRTLHGLQALANPAQANAEADGEGDETNAEAHADATEAPADATEAPLNGLRGNFHAVAIFQTD
jgi:hypothetical protein